MSIFTLFSVVEMADELDTALEQLQGLEVEIQDADAAVEQYKAELFAPIYDKRRKLMMKVPKFWYIVLAQHEDFQEFIRVEDMPYLENIKDIYVKDWVKSDEKAEIRGEMVDVKKRGFTLTIEFEQAKDLAAQSVTKNFEWELQEDGSKKLVSQAAEVEWPSSLDNINPQKIKDNAKAQSRPISPAEKKSYRLGMRSFWAFFAWTGKKEGKEFRNGEELALCISEDIFPAALDYYVLAMPGLNEENGEDEEVETGEELDLSDDEDAQEPASKKAKV